jgi:hypothetical protein
VPGSTTFHLDKIRFHSSFLSPFPFFLPFLFSPFPFALPFLFLFFDPHLMTFERRKKPLIVPSHEMPHAAASPPRSRASSTLAAPGSAVARNTGCGGDEAEGGRLIPISSAGTSPPCFAAAVCRACRVVTDIIGAPP